MFQINVPGFISFRWLCLHSWRVNVSGLTSETRLLLMQMMYLLLLSIVFLYQAILRDCERAHCGKDVYSTLSHLLNLTDQHILTISAGLCGINSSTHLYCVSFIKRLALRFNIIWRSIVIPQNLKARSVDKQNFKSATGAVHIYSFQLS